MSSKQKSCGKHFTDVEKKIPVEILKKYSHIIENKKSDSSSLEYKNTTWIKITSEYNLSRDIGEERSTKQLRKLWANMKTVQRNIITKERQSRLATGGGPEQKSEEIDPDIAFIVPNLLQVAPTHFSSDLSEVEVQERRQQISDNFSNFLHTEYDDDDEITNEYDPQSSVLDYVIEISAGEGANKLLQSPLADITNSTPKRRSLNILDESTEQPEPKLSQHSDDIPKDPGPSIKRKRITEKSGNVPKL